MPINGNPGPSTGDMVHAVLDGAHQYWITGTSWRFNHTTQGHSSNLVHGCMATSWCVMLHTAQGLTSLARPTPDASASTPCPWSAPRGMTTSGEWGLTFSTSPPPFLSSQPYTSRFRRGWRPGPMPPSQAHGLYSTNQTALLSHCLVCLVRSRLA